MPSDAIAQPVTAELTGREARWERHNSERQKRILTSAVELIEERAAGAEVSVQQIADRAGLAKSVVYRQFSGRDDLDRRVRAFVLGQFAAALDASMSISVGTLDQILTRTISAVAEWITEHPRIHEFMGTGPTDYDDESIDAISSLKATIADSARTTITEVGRSVGIDSSPFDSLPFAVVTMVEARSPTGSEAPIRSRAAKRSSPTSRNTPGTCSTALPARADYRSIPMSNCPRS